jgi:multisubunit Na+/H+ antiporter MnhE subunit
VKHVLPWLAWWVALFWLWLLLVGEWNGEQVVAAAIAATIAASVAELARTRTGLSAPLPLRLLAGVPQVLGIVVVDFGILAWALIAGAARRRIVRGKLVARQRPRGSWVTRGTGPRAWTVLLASLSPNAYVVDVDPDERRVLLHDLVPHRKSEDPV